MTTRDIQVVEVGGMCAQTNQRRDSYMLKNFLVTLLLLAASVIPSLGQTLLSIQVNPPQVTGFVGNTYGLQVLGTYSDGSIQDLTNSATWTSSNSTAVSVVQTFPQVTVLAQNGNETVTLIANSGVVGVQPATMQFTAIAAPNTLDTGGPTVHLRGGSQGAPPFSTITSGTVDSLNIATSDILVRIPVRSKDEIIPFEFSLVGNSNAVALPTNPFPWFVSTGIHGVVSGMLMDQVGTSHKTTQCHGLADATYTNFSVIEADGTQHPSTNPTLQVDDGVMYNGVLTHCQRTSVSLGTTDNSGLTFTWGVGNTVNKIQDQHGNTLTWGQPVNGQNSAILTDKNGNVMKNVPTSTGWKIVDAENVTVITATIHGAGNGTTDTYSYVDDTGTTQKYIVTYAGWTAKSVFGCGDQDFSGPANQYFLPISVTVPQLPNDSAAGTYQFYYESTGSGNDTSGRISSILYPTGGQTSYSYVWNGSAPINCTDHLTVPVMTHYLTPGGEWNYTNSGITGNYQTETVSVLQPDNNTTTYSFSEDYATEKNVASIEDTYVCYNGIASKSSCVGGVSNIGAFVNQTDVYISAANGAANTYNHVQTLFSSDRVTGKTLWDFPGTGTAKTTTNIQYETINGDSDLPTSIQVLDPTNGNAQVALTAISYDSYGNPSSTSKWISGSGSLSLSLTTNYVYNQNGTLKTITDPSGLTTTVDYNGACNSLVPTGTTNSFNSLVTAESYDSPCRVGQAISQTPFSGFPSSQTYDDPWLRIDTATDAAGNTVTIKRGLNNRVETTPFNSNITLTHIVSLDGLGRTVDDQTFNGTYYDTVQTAYDNMGRVSYVSAPFQCATAGYCTGGAGTTWTYDAAGRVYIVQDANGGTITHTYAADSSGVWTKTVLTPTPSGDQSTNGKTAITLTNGLGQQMESCAVNTYSDASACGSGFSGNGYITSYTYDALGDMLTQTRGVQVRTSTYDGVRRITSSKNPESGTTTYTYDLADSKCSSYVSAGRLVEVTDANSNVTCPQYDGLGRVVLKTYGGNAKETLIKLSAFHSQSS